MYRIKRIIHIGIGSLFFCVILMQILYSQNYQRDNFVIKLRPGITISIQRGADHRYLYGISAVDALNKQYDVLRMEKMFIDEINNELSRYYRVWLSNPRSDIIDIVNDFGNLTEIESAVMEPIGELLGQNHPNDPLYNFSLNGGSGTQEQWYLYNDGDMNDDGTPDGTTRADIYAPEAVCRSPGARRGAKDAKQD